MTSNVHIAVTSFKKHDVQGEVGEIRQDQFGAWLGATHDLHTVAAHDVVDIKRHTRTVSGTKITVLTIVTLAGEFEVKCFRA